MKQLHTRRKLTITVAVLASAFAFAGLAGTTMLALAQTKAKEKVKGGATPQQIQEACQRTQARIAKFQQFGIPEEFGSEEPFTFDPNGPGC
jgi:hypothetical protein